MPHYVCNRCGCTFDENEAFYEEFRHDEVPWGGKELFMTCPDCGAADFEDAAYCTRCGRPIKYGDLRGGYYCDECMEEITDIYHEHQFIRSEIDAYAEYLHECFGEGEP